jgi:hypothetical protein
MNRLQDYTAVTRTVECNEGTVDESREFWRMRSLRSWLRSNPEDVFRGQSKSSNGDRQTRAPVNL